MIRLIVLIVLTVSAAKAATFYVVNSLDESLGWVNLESGQFNAQAVTLGTIPNDVIAAENRLFVVNSGLNTLQIIDRISLTTLDEVGLAGTVNPYSAAVIDSEHVVVTGLLSGTATVVNTTTRAVDTTWVTGVSPQAVSVRDGLIYVLNTGVSFPNFGFGVLKRYSSETYGLVDSVMLGVNPQSMEFFQDELHVTCTGNYGDVEGSLQIISLNAFVVEETVALGGSPGSLAISGQHGIVAAGGWGNEGYVYRYNTETREVLRGSGNPILVGVGATDVVVIEDGRFAVTCFSDASLELRESNGSLIESFPMSAGAGALGIWSDIGDVADPKPQIVEKFGVLRAYPNPFNGTVSIEWSAVPPQAGVLEIRDLLGRVVGSIPVSAGQQESRWMPQSSSGREVAAGVYFARLVSNDTSSPARLIYIK